MAADELYNSFIQLIVLIEIFNFLYNLLEAYFLTFVIDMYLIYDIN